MKKLYVLFAMAFTVLLLGVVNTHAMGLLETPKQPIALFVQLDPNHVGKPLEISEELYTKVNEKLNTVGYEAIPFAKAQKDLKALAEKEGTRYVMVLATRVTSAEEKVNFWTGLRKNLTIMTNIIIYDAQEGDYVMDEDFSSVGKTSGSYDRAFHRAVEDTLTKIDLHQYLK